LNFEWTRRRRSSALQTPSQAERLNHDVAWMGWCVVFAAWEEVLSLKFVSLELEESCQFEVFRKSESRDESL
jgi:hypothetical protein